MTAQATPVSQMPQPVTPAAEAAPAYYSRDAETGPLRALDALDQHFAYYTRD